jgi:hypothetical protein
VSIWAPLGSSASPVLVAEGVRIIGMYNSAGTTVSPTPGDAATAPNSLSLAIPQADLQTFLGLSTPTVEPDSTVAHFTLDEGGTPSLSSSTSGTTSAVPVGSGTSSSTSSTHRLSSSPSSVGTGPSSHGVNPGTSAHSIHSRVTPSAKKGS